MNSDNAISATSNANIAESRNQVETFKSKMSFVNDLLINVTGVVSTLITENREMSSENKQKLHDALKPIEQLTRENEFSSGEDVHDSYKEYSYLDNVFDDEVYATIHQVNAFNNVHNLDLMSNASSSSNPQENTNYTSDSENYNVSL